MSQELIKIFENSKRYFNPYVEFYMIEPKIKVQKFDHSTTLTLL